MAPSESALASSEARPSSPVFPCLHRLFEDQAARIPEATALVYRTDQLTYGALNARANQLARYLQKQGIGPGSLVGIGLSRTPAMLVALFAVWKAGGAYVPLDPDYPAERLAFMIEDAKLRLVLTDAASQGSFGPAGLCIDDRWRDLGTEADNNLDASPASEDLAYVMYTSGSTGRPKGAMVTHQGLSNYVTWAVQAYGLAPGGSVPVHSSLSFDLTVTSLFPPLLAGAEVELLPEADGILGLVEALKARKRSLVKITPAHLDLLNQELSLERLADITDAFIIGGENLTADKLEIWRRHAPQTRLINEYGPTETVVGCCVYEVQAGDPHTGSVPIGHPIANTRLHVLDEDLRPVSPGSAGELYIGGAGVARGYLNRPELTESRFLPDPFSDQPGAKLYRTGDLVRYRDADGVLEYLGRTDDQVKIAGYRIELGEIETALAGHHQVRACAVVVDEGPEEKTLVAFVVPRPGVAIETASLGEDLKRHLPPYMIPKRFVLVDALPLTPNGKVDRKALLYRPQAPADKTSEASKDTSFTGDSTDTLVARLFAEVLELPEVPPGGDFFDLGGRSLAAARLMMRLRAATGLDLPLRLLYESPTARGLAAAVDAHRWATAARSAARNQDREDMTL